MKPILSNHTAMAVLIAATCASLALVSGNSAPASADEKGIDTVVPKRKAKRAPKKKPIARKRRKSKAGGGSNARTRRPLTVAQLRRIAETARRRGGIWSRIYGSWCAQGNATVLSPGGISFPNSNVRRPTKFTQIRPATYNLRGGRVVIRHRVSMIGIMEYRYRTSASGNTLVQEASRKLSGTRRQWRPINLTWRRCN
jgi:hypothetical protein